MKLATAALLIAPVAAFNMDMTFSLGKKKAPSMKKAAAAPKKAASKAPAKAAPAPVKAPKGPALKLQVSGKTTPAQKKAAAIAVANKGGVVATAWANGARSTALPYDVAPASLDGSLLGDVGFDPFGFSITPINGFENVASKNGTPDAISWYREAELIHGRIAQVAVVGFIAPGLFGTLPGNEWTGVDAYSYTNPLEAFDKVPGLAIVQIFLFMAYLEGRRIRIIKEEGANYIPGDLRLGQGEGRFNPFGLDYTPEQYEEKRLQELKHCRLAMVGIFGLWAQARASGISVVDQLAAGLTTPDYVAKAGYFLPEGI